MIVQQAPFDYDSVPMQCEVCGKAQPRGAMRSIALVYAMPGGGLPGYMCPDRETSPLLGAQHVGCCYEHAMLAMLLCLFEHMHTGPHELSGADISHPVLVRLRADLGAFVQEMGQSVPPPASSSS